MSIKAPQLLVDRLAGERRQITALFYDIVGSTELLNELDPEEFGDLQRTLHNRAAALIASHGGYLERVQGDGGCAYFGFPEPSEDAAECAVAAALKLVDSCQQLATLSGSNLRLRVGVATGLVIVADTSNSRLPGVFEVIGLAPTLAARIQSEAAPDSVAVADATFRLTKGAFDFEAIGVRQLKGFEELIQLWRPVTRLRKTDRFTTYRRTSAHLVGRRDELELLRRRWARSQSGAGQLVCLCGDPGIGKSRLVSEFRSNLNEQGIADYVFQCEPRGDTQPLHPFVESIRQAVADEAGEGEPDARTVVRSLRALAPGVGEASAEIVAFLISGAEDDEDRGYGAGDHSADEARERAVDAILDVLTAAASKPLLMVIEDVHWADSMTNALLARLPAWVRSRPVLAVVTSRDASKPGLLGENVLSVSMLSLTVEATSELVDRIWETPPPQGVDAYIYAKSDGVPLFAEQLALLLKEAGETTQEVPEAWDALLRERRILGLQDLIAARLAGLGRARRVSQVASVVGREFSQRLLADILRLEAFDAPLDEAIETIIAAGIFRRPSGSTLQFCHALVQDAAYDSILKSERRDIHGRIVDLVRSGLVAPLSDETMSWHCVQAGQPLEAARHAILAAESCVVRSATQEAGRLLDMAERQLAEAGSAQDAGDLLLRLLTARGPVAAALFGRGGEEARSVYERGVSLCAERADRDRTQWFPLYWGWWFTSPDFESQRARSDILVRDLEGSADPEVRLQSFHCAWATNIDAGRHQHCLSCVSDGLKLYDEDRARFNRGRYGGHDAKVCALGEQAFSLWFIGDEDRALESVEASKQWAERINHTNSMLHALEFEIELKRYRNDYAGVIAAADRIGRLAPALPGGMAKAELFRAWARGLTGDAEAGLAEFEARLDRQRQIATYEGAPVFEGMRAELFEHAGRDAQALTILDDAIAASTRSGQVFWLAELLRHRARIRLAERVSEDVVVDDLRRAFAIASDQGAAALVARVGSDLAQFERAAVLPIG